MSISLSDNNRYVTLTGKSAFIYEWGKCEKRPWLFRVVKSCVAFFSDKDLKHKSLDKWMQKHSSKTLTNELHVALEDRKIRIASIHQEKNNRKRKEKDIQRKKRELRLNKPPIPPEQKAKQK
ncbi:MAG: hypothetical protein KAG53_00030 [Endozoicomonadaceae bacterium]|nr:hypothetical protein [Endozoicomonadaceae bacterium]